MTAARHAMIAPGTFAARVSLRTQKFVSPREVEMPATRPIWKGQLRLSLVSIPVEVFTATKSNAKPAFRQIHEPTGKPIHYEKVVDGVGPVERDDIKKG